MKMKYLSLALIVLLAGCKTIGDDYQRPQVQLPAKYTEADALFNGEHTAQAQWWMLYQDDALNALIKKAQKNNTSVQLAVANIEQADAQLRETGASLLPSVDLSTDATRSRVTGAGPFPVFGPNPRNGYNYALNASIELDVWGKLKRAKESGRANILANQYAKETVKWSLASLVANHYLTIRSIDAQIALNQTNQTISQESLGLTQRREAGGVASMLDVHQASLVLNDLQTQAESLTRLRALSEHQLAILTGDLNLTVAKASLMDLPTPPIPPAGLPASLLDARPDIKQAEQQMVIANANIALAKAAFYPSIALTGSFGGQSLALSDLLKSAARVWDLGLGLTLPIFNGGRLDAQLQQANAVQKQTLANYLSTMQTAFTEVNDALVNVRIYQTQEKLALEKQTTSKSMLTIAENRYKGGYSGYIDVLDAQRTHHTATLAYVQARQNVLTATVDLFKALGGGWQPTDLIQPDAKPLNK